MTKRIKKSNINLKALKLKQKAFLITIFTILIVISSCSRFNNKIELTSYIDPTIGNVSRFLVPTYPTFHLPNQMLRMVPQKNDYISDEVEAFPLQVASHRDKGLFLMKVETNEVAGSGLKKNMYIDHDLETVLPWLYSTYLIEDDIRVSFTPGEKSGIFKFEFPENSKSKVLIRGTSNFKSQTESEGVFTLQDKIIYKTRGIFSETSEMFVYAYGKFCDESGNPLSNLEFAEEEGGLTINLSKDVSSDVFLKYAISYISFDQSEINFSKELEDVNFDDLARQGKNRWEETMSKVEIEGGTLAQKRTFYTSLYRTYERMVDINEYGQYFSGYDGQVHKSERPFYVDDWIWDTYLAHHPLRTILNPEMENDILHSYTEMYKQSGWMPTFPRIHGNHMCMNAYHSSSIFIDGYRKGLVDWDIEKAYEGVRKNLMEGTFIPWRQGTPRRPIDDFYHENGYFPCLHPGEEETEPQMDGFEKRQGVAVTLGISYDFWALSEFAKELGKKEDHELFSVKEKDYKKLWHPEHALFMPKDDEGKWINIDPKKDGGPGFREYYDENNGWTYAWDVKHDIEGLTELIGGKKATEKRLDQLFREPLGMRKREFALNGSNSTGMVGQFSMGNEPSFHIPYIYNYIGAPWKTQKRTRFLLDVWFKDNIFGIPGDEDGGGMTSFVVFSSMGIYPFTPGIPIYTITSPVFEKVSIHLDNGKDFTVIAKGANKKNKYIQRAYINGEEIFEPFISHEQIMAGVTLELELSELPNKEWGK
ncbi:MAG: glycoside hydrolase family 92 protein [Bacteroidales bacterium]|nr:glycoside hydrolase family 92 protein [Bacteroidales bacterium]MCF8391398.1 glycoside hydrolase family 92 protein [Bacteroidales bacterium]